MSDNLRQFTLSIDLGNEAMGGGDEMWTPHQVADALAEVAERLREGDYHPGHTRSIMDGNGNRVGSYRMPRDPWPTEERLVILPDGVHRENY